MNKMTDKRNHIVIMAGGIGSRFWPMSTTECPKQFIDVLGVGRSLLHVLHMSAGELNQRIPKPMLL